MKKMKFVNYLFIMRGYQARVSTAGIFIGIIIVMIFPSCIGILAFRELDKDPNASYVEKVRYHELPSFIKKVAVSNYLLSDSLLYFENDLELVKVPIKSVNRSIDGPNSNTFNLLKHGDHFRLNGKRFFLGNSANPKIYFQGYLYYTKTFNLHLKPKTLQEVSQKSYRSPSDLVDSVMFYKVDLSRWLK